MRPQIDIHDHSRLRINAMLVVKINVVNTQTIQRLLTAFFNVIRLAADSQKSTLLVANEPEFGANEDFVAVLFEYSTEKPFVLAVAIHVSRVPECASRDK